MKIPYAIPPIISVGVPSSPSCTLINDLERGYTKRGAIGLPPDIRSKNNWLTPIIAPFEAGLIPKNSGKNLADGNDFRAYNLFLTAMVDSCRR
jgi:hypothetical protein